MTEPAVDLGVITALASSRSDRPVRQGTVVFGEVGLTGEVRPVRWSAARLKEAARLGFERAVLAAPDRDRTGTPTERDVGIALETAATVREAVALALSK